MFIVLNKLLRIFEQTLPVDARANISGSATANAVKNHSGYSLVDGVNRPVSVKFLRLKILFEYEFT